MKKQVTLKFKWKANDLKNHHMVGINFVSVGFIIQTALGDGAH